MINETRHNGKAGTGAEATPTALLFCTDLMFLVRLQGMARAAGYRYVAVRPGASLPTADVLVVDLGVHGAWEGAVREAAARGMPVVAFGPHTDAESRKRAKAAGAMRVLANSNLVRDLPLILKNLREGAGAAAAAVSDTGDEPEG